MPVRKAKIKAGDRVMHDDYACPVIEAKATVLTIRTKFGYVITIPRKTAKLAPKP